VQFGRRQIGADIDIQPADRKRFIVPNGIEVSFGGENECSRLSFPSGIGTEHAAIKVIREGSRIRDFFRLTFVTRS
jgi:hypothetical protein